MLLHQLEHLVEHLLVTEHLLGEGRLVRERLHIGGVFGDPLHPYIKRFAWRGVLVEPLPHLYRELIQTYAGMPGIRFENAAISRLDSKNEVAGLSAFLNSLGFNFRIFKSDRTVSEIVYIRASDNGDSFYKFA